MSKLFISHSSQDDAFVRGLQQALGDLKQDVWIDSRELRGGDPLWPEIQKAIEDASAYAVVVSPASLQSKWVGKELRHALDVQKQRGRDKFPVIPLSLDDIKLGVLEEFFGEESLYIPVSSAAGGIEAAMNAILVAMGKRLPADVPVATQPKAELLEELVLELTDLKFHEQDGVRRASARARLVYEPATPGQREVSSAQNWRFVAPLGPIEAEELRWYLEKYAIWPSEYFRDRARKVEANLVKWGQLLHDAALPGAHTANVMNAWARIDDHAGRRFSVHVDAALEAGAPDAEVETAREAATLLLGLPWELLHDGDGFLFQRAKPTRVRRRLPNTRVLDVSVVATPIRILLVTARPEDDACVYIDHRSSALPLGRTRSDADDAGAAEPVCASRAGAGCRGCRADNRSGHVAVQLAAKCRQAAPARTRGARARCRRGGAGRERFEVIERNQPGCGAERMANVYFTERGDCLRRLGRLDGAAAIYEESIRYADKFGDDRGVAVGKIQLGTVCKNQHRFQEALKAFEEARERFTRLDEPGSVAVSWHQTGLVYQEAGQPEAAEDAYRKSLAIDVRLGDVAAQASTLGQLGTLYGDVLGRPEEAAAFYRQAVDKSVESRDVAKEGTRRSNLAAALCKLRRLDEAPQEIRRAIECKAQFGHASEPWKTWDILADIETDAGNPTAAAEAKRKAIECCLAYRRDDGENHSSSGRLCLAVTQFLLASDPAAAASLVQHNAASYEAADFIQALQAIVAGNRDRTLANAPDLSYSMAGEILFLLEKLEKAGK